MKELVEYVARTLVDDPDRVEVRAIDKRDASVLELRVAPTDLGKVIGRHGRTARSLRTLLSAAAMKARKRATLEIVE